MPGAYLWAWDDGNNKWTQVAVNVDGKLEVVLEIVDLNDLADVYVPTPTDGYYLYWNDGNSRWECKALDASDIGAGELPTARLPSNIKTLTITFIIDGGGAAIATGEKGHLEIPFACTITGWTILADRSGSIVIDVWKDTYGNFPPTVTDTIAGSEKPTISTAQKNQDLDLTTWTTAITTGDILAFNVDSCSTIQRVTLSLKVTKT